MATVTELFEGRSETFQSARPRAEIPYIVTEGIDEADVRAALESAVPTQYAGMSLSSIEISERINETTWRAVAIYGEDRASYGPTLGDHWDSFDTSGGTRHITQSIRTVSASGPKASNDLEGVIGFDGRDVKGVDITIPAFHFSETHLLPKSAITTSYQQKIFALTGKVNQYTFKGFQAGEVLFLGAAGSRRDANYWELQFRFAAMKNQSNLSVGGIGGINKEGWEYLWVQYGHDVDEDKSLLIKKPTAVYVEQVYEKEHFGGLGIGT